MVKPNSRIAGSSCFFRIFSPKAHGNDMKIPSDFVSEFLKKVPDRMVLRCASGGPWHVRVFKTGSYVFLKHGWQKFVQDNTLQENNFLFFTYKGNAELLVQIFEDTGLERNNSAAAASETHQEGGASSTVQNLDPGRNGERNVVRKERIRSFLSSCSNDFFEKQLKHYSVSSPFTLRIPLDFAEDNLGRDKTAVRLINAKNNEACKVNYTYNARNKQCIFVGGWRRFARRNNLKIGDLCIFELVGKRTFRVVVF